MIDEVLSAEELCMVDETSPECNVSKSFDSWLLDSGASHHMCPHRNWFTSYENVNDSSVFMGIMCYVRLLGWEISGLRCMITQLEH